jgi:hypothetical protein
MRGNGGAGVPGIYCRFKLPIPANKVQARPTETEIGCSEISLQRNTSRYTLFEEHVFER